MTGTHSARIGANPFQGKSSRDLVGFRLAEPMHAAHANLVEAVVPSGHWTAHEQAVAVNMAPAKGIASCLYQPALTLTVARAECGRYVIDFARGRPTNPARIPIGANADWYYSTLGPQSAAPDGEGMVADISPRAYLDRRATLPVPAGCRCSPLTTASRRSVSAPNVDRG